MKYTNPDSSGNLDSEENGFVKGKVPNIDFLHYQMSKILTNKLKNIE